MLLLAEHLARRRRSLSPPAPCRHRQCPQGQAYKVYITAYDPLWGGRAAGGTLPAQEQRVSLVLLSVLLAACVSSCCFCSLPAPHPWPAPHHSQLKMRAEAAPIKPKNGAVSWLLSAMAAAAVGLCYKGVIWRCDQRCLVGELVVVYMQLLMMNTVPLFVNSWLHGLWCTSWRQRRQTRETQRAETTRRALRASLARRGNERAPWPPPPTANRRRRRGARKARLQR